MSWFTRSSQCPAEASEAEKRKTMRQEFVLAAISKRQQEILKTHPAARFQIMLADEQSCLTAFDASGNTELAKDWYRI